VSAAARLLLAALLSALLATPALAWWDVWPNEAHQALASRSADIAAERYPAMAAEVAANRDGIMSGTHYEDFDEDETNGPYCDYSGYCVAVPGAWWPTSRRPLHAIQWVHDSLNPNNWTAAVAMYPNSKSDSYHMLGHVLHNLQDLFIPSHAHIAPHGSGTSGLVENHSWPIYADNFEQWCEVTDNELNLAQASRIPEAGLDTLMVAAAAYSSTDNESAAFYPSLYHAVPDTAGAWGRYRPYPSGSYPCGYDNIDNDHANAWSLYIVPRCCEGAAAAIRAFYVACNPPGSSELVPRNLPRLRIDSPVSAGSPLRFTGLETSATVALLDVTGQTVARLNLSPSRAVLCPSLPTGTYVCRITTGGDTFTQPIVVVARPR